MESGGGGGLAVQLGLPSARSFRPQGRGTDEVTLGILSHKGEMNCPRRRQANRLEFSWGGRGGRGPLVLASEVTALLVLQSGLLRRDNRTRHPWSFG